MWKQTIFVALVGVMAFLTPSKASARSFTSVMVNTPFVSVNYQGCRSCGAYGHGGYGYRGGYGAAGYGYGQYGMYGGGAYGYGGGCGYMYACGYPGSFSSTNVSVAVGGGFVGPIFPGVRHRVRSRINHRVNKRIHRRAHRKARRMFRRSCRRCF